MAPDVHFGCTQCGLCCRNIKIPLSSAEAVDWLDDGNRVQIICEASPWTEDRSAQDPSAAHVKRRSFLAMSGGLPVRIVVMLVADLVGDCPNLQPDFRCGIYDRRPRVCRIYPAEINPTVTLEPARKSCPPEAWNAQQPLLMRNGAVTDTTIRADVLAYRDADGRDVDVRQRICAELKLSDAAVAHEGFVVHSPDAAALSAALRSAIGGADVPDVTDWRLLTDRADTLLRLKSSRANAIAPEAHDAAFRRYIGLKRAS